jgi:curli biogenesis system outer membrane secretion channel CsgG
MKRQLFIVVLTLAIPCFAVAQTTTAPPANR